MFLPQAAHSRAAVRRRGVTATINASAASLAAGTYAATLRFTNQNDNSTQSRTFTLTVGPLVQNNGFEAGNFSELEPAR